MNPNHRLTYSRFYGDDVLDFSFNDTEETSNTNVNIQSDFNTSINWPWGNQTNGLTWRWIVSPTVVAKTFYSNSRYRFDFDLSFEDRDTYTYADSTVAYFTNFNFEIYDIINDHTLETEIAWKINDNQEVTGGFQIKSVKFDLGIDLGITNQDTSLTYSPLSLDDTTREISFFIQDKWDISEKLKFQGGIRGTDYNLHDQLYLDPRLGMKYHYSDNVALKFNWGLYHQFLTTANNQDENLRLVELWLGIPEDKPASVAQHIIAGIE